MPRISALLLFGTVAFAGCDSSSGGDTGTCTITRFSGSSSTFEDVSLEECQDRYGNTAGASGWSWDPD